MTAFLFAMQAAGLVSSVFGANNQMKYIKLGRKLEKEQFETNLAAVRVQSADQSLSELKNLKQNLGAQAVMDAARGNRAGASAWGISNAVNAYDNDERKRRLNLMASESQLRAGNVTSALNTLKSETELGQSLLGKAINTIPTTSLFNTGKKQPTTNQEFNWGY